MTAALAACPDNLTRYMAEVNRHPLLTHDEELSLARRLKNHGDLTAAHALVVANLRFVVRMAHAYRGYGLKTLDLIQEGNVGLMLAVKKFDPERGYRLITYAVWWIRASMQSFIMRSWSLVRMGASRMQRKLFFRLRAERAKAAQQGQAAAITAAELATRLGADEAEVDAMAQRLAARDFSLDAPHEHSAESTYLDGVACAASSPEEALVARQEQAMLRRHAARAMRCLNQTERTILERRMLSERPASLQELGDAFSLSRERVRQLESRVVGKLRAAYAREAGGLRATATAT